MLVLTELEAFALSEIGKWPVFAYFELEIDTGRSAGQ
jgi:hypothetical protein